MYFLAEGVLDHRGRRDLVVLVLVTNVLVGSRSTPLPTY